MNKIIFFSFLALLALKGTAQTETLDQLNIKKDIRLQGRTVYFFSNDSAFIAADSTSLPTTLAVKEYLKNRLGNLTISIGHTFVVPSQDSMLNLNDPATLPVPATIGDVASIPDSNKTYILRDTPTTNLANWVIVLTPAQVISFNGRTGNVIPESGDYDYTQISGLAAQLAAKQNVISNLSDTAIYAKKKDTSTILASKYQNSLKANDSEVVHKSGNENIYNQKTFVDSVKVPTRPTSDSSTNAANTAWVKSKLLTYLKNTDTTNLSNRINLKVNILDTTAMLAPYLRKRDTASLSNRIDGKQNIIPNLGDTSKYLKNVDTTVINIINQGAGVRTLRGSKDSIYSATIKGTGGISVVKDSDSSVLITGGISSNGFFINIPIVTWSGTGLIYDISAGSLIWNNLVVDIPATQVTLDAADADNPRIDAFYVDTLGNTNFITGDAETNPVTPQVEYGQFLLTTAWIGANDTIPSNVSIKQIYDEHTGGEYTTASAGTGVVDFDNTVNPYHLTKDIKISSNSTNFYLKFTSPAGMDSAHIGDVLKFFLYADSVFAAGYTFQFFNGTKAASNAFRLNVAGWGYNPATLHAYQNVNIPFSAFVFTSPYNILRITAKGINTHYTRFDDIQIQSGVYQYLPTNYDSKLDSVTANGGALYQWSKGSSKYITSLSGIVRQTYTGSSSVTVNNATTWLVINPSSTAAAITITFPSSPVDNQDLIISFGGTITSGTVVTALTISGSTLPTFSPTSVDAGEIISYRFNSDNNDWYRQ